MASSWLFSARSTSSSAEVCRIRLSNAASLLWTRSEYHIVPPRPMVMRMAAAYCQRRVMGALFFRSSRRERSMRGQSMSFCQLSRMD